jgi:hypothetical protein
LTLYNGDSWSDVLSQILFHSVELQYFLTNLPWLIGSLGTMAEDVTIFVQFSMFGEKHDSAIE